MAYDLPLSHNDASHLPHCQCHSNTHPLAGLRQPCSSSSLSASVWQSESPGPPGWPAPAAASHSALGSQSAHRCWPTLPCRPCVPGGKREGDGDGVGRRGHRCEHVSLQHLYSSQVVTLHFPHLPSPPLPSPPLPSPPIRPHLVLKCLHTDLQYAEQLVDVADLELAPPLAQ